MVVWIKKIQPISCIGLIDDEKTNKEVVDVVVNCKRFEDEFCPQEIVVEKLKIIIILVMIVINHLSRVLTKI